MRKGKEGVTRLEVCLEANGRVTSATLASSSHPVLDRTALSWVRDRKFMPAKVDGVPQPVCGHGVDYEWKLNR
jgi:TonB family protein